MGRKRFRRVFKKTLGSQKVMKVNLQMGIVAINLRSKLKIKQKDRIQYPTAIDLSRTNIHCPELTV